MSILTSLWVLSCWSTGYLGVGQRNFKASQQDCIDATTSKIRQSPEKKYLYTLDGKRIFLEILFNQCDQNWPNCLLFHKFYYWVSEIKWVVSPTTQGPLNHKIRIYYNPMSICYPEKVHPGRTHGDVAEFYDANGAFMGFAVYMGEGQYFSLPYAGSQGMEESP